MDLQPGNPVMHWTYGLGHITSIEERSLAEHKTRYYAVRVRDLTIWVPDDKQLVNRLRLPTPAQEFDELLAILSAPSEPLPVDQHERKLILEEILKDGLAASLCRVIRDLYDHQQTHSLNYIDQNVLKRTSNAFVGEWSHVHSLTVPEAEAKLRHLLSARPVLEKVKK